jgi:hypothetical protein
MREGVCDKQHHSQRELYRIPDALCGMIAAHVSTIMADDGVGG